MTARRGFARAGALVAVWAVFAAVAGAAEASSPAGVPPAAAPTSVAAGHVLCQEAYCSVFGPNAPDSHGPPGSQGLFTIFCPLVQEVTTVGGSGEAALVQEFQFKSAAPFVLTWPGGKEVALSDYSQGIYGGELAFWSFAFTVPGKSADALILNGGGYCQFQSTDDPTKVGYSDTVEWDYFWIDNPNYWKLTSALLASLAGQFGSMQLITDEGFGAAGFGARGSPVSGGPVVGPTPPPPPPPPTTTTTTKGGQLPTETTTTSTTLPPTTTTTTRRGAR
jgi:hypothetical protein